MNSTVDQFAHTVGSNVTFAQNNLMEAFSLKEDQTAQIEALAKKLQITVLRPVFDKDGKPVMDPQTNKQKMEAATPDLKGLQLITQQRFEHSTQIFSAFSNTMEKLDQLKQRLIQKLGQ
jgi:hypothetical protein